MWASAETCGKCKAVAEASAKATETQVVKALAEARVDVAAVRNSARCSLDVFVSVLACQWELCMKGRLCCLKSVVVA